MDEECGDSTPIPNQGRPAVDPHLDERAGGCCVLPQAMACAAHIKAGGWVALLEPFAVTRPGERGAQREFRLVALIGGN